MSIFQIFRRKAFSEQRIAELTIENYQKSEWIRAKELRIKALEIEGFADKEQIEALRVALDRSKSDELTSAARLEAYEREAVKLRSEKDEAYRVAGLSVKETEIYRDAVKMLVERGAISAIEVAQLNLGRYVPGVEGLPPTVEFETPTHGKSAVDFGMKPQATEAKFRQVKQYFQQYQDAVKTILDTLNGLEKKNVVTTEDLRKVRKLRQDLSDILGRSI